MLRAERGGGIMRQQKALKKNNIEAQNCEGGLFGILRQSVQFELEKNK